MEKALKISYRGGYTPEKLNLKTEDTPEAYTESYETSFSKCLLDPLFWQALGKAEGWEEEEDGDCYGWQYHWHAFIDHLIANKPIDEFFDKLLAN